MSSETQSFKGVGTPTTRMYGLMAVVALGWVFLGGLFSLLKTLFRVTPFALCTCTFLPLGLHIWPSLSQALLLHVG